MLKKIGSKFLLGMVILAVVYSFAKEGYISHIANSIEETFSHTCMKTVTEATFYDTTQTYKEAFSKYFKNGEWKYFDSNQGNIVEFNGVCRYDNQEVNCTIQYVLTNDKKSFNVQYFGFNKLGQSNFIYLALMKSIKETILNPEQNQNKTITENTNNQVQNDDNSIQTGDTIHNNPNYNQQDDFNENPEKYGIATEGSDACQ